MFATTTFVPHIKWLAVVVNQTHLHESRPIGSPCTVFCDTLLALDMPKIPLALTKPPATVFQLCSRKLFGRGQIIKQELCDGRKVFVCGSDPRADGCVVPCSWKCSGSGCQHTTESGILHAIKLYTLQNVLLHNVLRLWQKCWLYSDCIHIPVPQYDPLDGT